MPPSHPLLAAAEAVSGQGVPTVVTLADLLRRPHVHYPLLQQHGLGAATLEVSAVEAASEAAASTAGSSCSSSAAGAAEEAQQDAQQDAQQQQQQDVQQPPVLQALTTAEQEAAEIDIK